MTQLANLENTNEAISTAQLDCYRAYTNEQRNPIDKQKEKRQEVDNTETRFQHKKLGSDSHNKQPALTKLTPTTFFWFAGAHHESHLAEQLSLTLSLITSVNLT